MKDDVRNSCQRSRVRADRVGVHAGRVDGARLCS